MISLLFKKKWGGYAFNGVGGQKVEWKKEGMKEGDTWSISVEDIELRKDRDQYLESYHGFCETMARMHEAALGVARGPIR